MTMLLGALWLGCVVPPRAVAAISADGDTAMHLFLGELMLERGTLLQTEPSTWLVPDRQYIDHEWLAQILLALSARVFGPAGLALVAGTLIASTIGLVWKRMQRLGATMWPSLIVILLTILLQRTNSLARPHLFGWLLATLLLALWERRQDDEVRGPQAAWATFGLTLTWIQVHGSALLAPLVVGCFFLARVVRAAADSAQQRQAAYDGAAVLLAVLATFLNPWGWQLHAHFLPWLANPYLQSLTVEFMHPDWGGPTGAAVLTWWALCAVALFGPRQRPDLAHVLLIGGISILAARSMRHAPILAILTAPWVAARLSTFLADRTGWPGVAAVYESSTRLAEEDRGRWGLGWLLVLAVASAVYYARAPGSVDFDPQVFPQRTVAWVQERPELARHRMFNSFMWGGYLSRALFPEHRTSMNSWQDHIGETLMRRYMKVHTASPEATRILDEEGVDWVLFDTRSSLSRRLDESEAWRVCHRDPVASVWVRTEAPWSAGICDPI
ncbi:MAG: hypothetical protein EP330_00780 [Deltaproteobacteria bacterium]|nr:MAG: hypothetical protein EP330_00780 [Deltaproteobacteria bacterium]